MTLHNLTPGLKLRISQHRKALDRAVHDGYLTFSPEGKLNFTFGSKSLMAYFWGRLLCGDSSYLQRKTLKWLWKPGKDLFPDQELAASTGLEGIGVLRRQRVGKALPSGWELIDEYFSA